MKLPRIAALTVVASGCLPWWKAEAQTDPKIEVISTKTASVGRGVARVYVALDANGTPLALGVSQFPTKYCIRHSERTGRYTVSLEGFVSRTAR